jgi:uncharacterized protein (TIGR02453 family)
MPASLQTVFTFLEDLRFHNNREWFNANRKRYDEARAAVEAFTEDVIRQFKPVEDLGETTAKECLYRINRDIRFSKDKTPYKINFGVLIADGGRKSTGRSYYVNIQPGESFIAGGVYDPSPEQLKRVREVIARDPAALRQIIENPDFVRYFGAIRGEALKTAPKGYAADHPAIDLLKYKQFLAIHDLNDDDVLKDNLAAFIVKVCAPLKPFEGYFHEIRMGGN